MSVNGHMANHGKGVRGPSAMLVFLMEQQISQRAMITETHAGRRLDAVLAELWPDYSRSRLAEWIKAGQVRVDGRQVKPRHALTGGETVTLETVMEARADSPRPEPIGLKLLHEDKDCLVIDKPPGLVVHPGSGNPDGTLVNALLHRDPALASLPRAGLIHRLDKDTSGCLLVARTLAAHTWLIRAMKRREIKRHYLALVRGELLTGGTVDAPLGRHPVDRRRQVVRDDGRRAVTHYRIRHRLASATLLDVELETGRTHQIRVHMAHIRHPIVGDPVYGQRGAPAGLSQSQRQAWLAFPRQALHARRLAFPHPGGGDQLSVEAELPEDMAALIAVLAGS